MDMNVNKSKLFLHIKVKNYLPDYIGEHDGGKLAVDEHKSKNDQIS
jgi:hypothetical protein